MLEKNKSPSAMHSPHHISTPSRHPLLPRITRAPHIHYLGLAHPGIISSTRITRRRTLIRQRATLVVWIEVSLWSRACGSWSALCLAVAVVAVLVLRLARLLLLLLWVCCVGVVVLVWGGVFVALRGDGGDGGVGCWVGGLVWGGGCVCCWA